jgi:alpha,alpha-trehalose phosphorylase
LRVEVNAEEANYQVLGDGEPLEVVHHGETILVGSDAPSTYKIPPIVPRQRPEQPFGRAPAPRLSNIGPTRRNEP